MLACGFLTYTGMCILVGLIIIYFYREHLKSKYKILPKWRYLYADKNYNWIKYECGHCFEQFKLYEGRQLPKQCLKCNAKMRCEDD